MVCFIDCLENYALVVYATDLLINNSDVNETGNNTCCIDLLYRSDILLMHALTFLLSHRGELVNEERFPEIDPRGVTIGLVSRSL